VAHTTSPDLHAWRLEARSHRKRIALFFCPTHYCFFLGITSFDPPSFNARRRSPLRKERILEPTWFLGPNCLRYVFGSGYLPHPCFLLCQSPTTARGCDSNISPSSRLSLHISPSKAYLRSSSFLNASLSIVLDLEPSEFSSILFVVSIPASPVLAGFTSDLSKAVLQAAQLLLLIRNVIYVFYGD
jgi:hypothetical protein